MYKVGIIGCGWISTAHMNGYKNTSGIEVTSAADIGDRQLKLFGEEWNIPAGHLYGDYREMLKNKSLDILSVCTPASNHAEIVREAVRYSPKAIVCEKPIALSLKDAHEMISVCKASDCELIICHQRRFENRYLKARELVFNGTIGKVISISTSSGDLFEDGTHAIDLMRYLIGDKKVKSVIGQVDFGDKKQIYGHLRDYAALGHILFEDNIQGIIITEELMRRISGRADASLSFQIVGEKGMLEVAGGNYPQPGWISLKTKNRWEKLDISDELLGTPKRTPHRRR